MSKNRISGKETMKRELDEKELEKVVGGKPHLGQGFIDFFSWAACGFNHHYVPTGKTKYSVDFVMKADFYEVECTDCGHKTWKRGQKPDEAVTGEFPSDWDGKLK